jgi:hypothetical protein
MKAVPVLVVVMKLDQTMELGAQMVDETSKK